MSVPTISPEPQARPYAAVPHDPLKNGCNMELPQNTDSARQDDPDSQAPICHTLIAHTACRVYNK